MKRISNKQYFAVEMILNAQLESCEKEAKKERLEYIYLVTELRNKLVANLKEVRELFEELDDYLSYLHPNKLSGLMCIYDFEVRALKAKYRQKEE